MIEIKQEEQCTTDEQYHITADASYIDDRTQVLNHCETFSIVSRSGDILPLGKEVQGIYYQDTRFINELILKINGFNLTLLSSNIKEKNEILSVDLTNPTIHLENGLQLSSGSIHVHRSQFVRNGHFHEKIEIENHDSRNLDLHMSLVFNGDFKDIFEVRGLKRDKRGTFLGFKYPDAQTLVLHYKGLDQIIRECKIMFNHQFIKTDKEGEVKFQLALNPKKVKEIAYSITFSHGKMDKSIRNYHMDRSANETDIEESKDYIPLIETSNEQFTHWINRSRADLVSLMANTPTGKYPYAGVPWYNTAFGRDGLITALETIWAAPKLARDVLFYLAAHQADHPDELADAEPGKILHETRGGEMVALNEVPFRKYYGTIDATPLFIMLAGEHFTRTGDLDTLKKLWPAILKAMEWINVYGDLDGDGYVEYQHKSVNGLTNQGWKDSHDAVSHANGELAKPPIALCEVQGYVYSAKQHAAQLAHVLGEKDKAEKWSFEAQQLKEKFNRDFWDEELNCFVIALDGEKKPCRVKSSNAGQVLFTGIAQKTKAQKLVQTLLKPDMFSGWGIRTLSANEFRYNPMSYHNGSVWPHDVAIIAEGMGRYGFQQQALQLMTGLFDASLFINLQRLPELFCGMERRKGEGPTAYPVACSPQGWSVAAVYLFLKAILQLQINHIKKEISFHKPILPDYLEAITIKNLELGSEKVDLELTRHGKNNMIGVNWNYEGVEWELKVVK